MSFPYQKILVLGATSGIGEALASQFAANGKKVIVAGRRQENLDRFVNQHGADKSSSYAFDISKLDEIPSFAAEVIKEHPDLDSVFLNAGIQRGHDFAKPESVELDVINEEFIVNYLSFIHVAVAFLPHLQQKSKSTPASLLFTTSSLAIVPMLRAPNYCASKAALHAYILVLREQLKDDADSDVKVIELLPPAVQTELHDEDKQPDIKNGRSMGMPLDEYVAKTWEGLSQGKEQIPVGPMAAHFAPDGFETKKQETFHQRAQARKSGK